MPPWTQPRMGTMRCCAATGITLGPVTSVNRDPAAEWGVSRSYAVPVLVGSRTGFECRCSGRVSRYAAAELMTTAIAMSSSR